MLFLNRLNAMDIQAEKLNLIKWLTEVQEPSVIERFIALKNDQQMDWWDQIDAEERSEIEEGLTQADKGEVFTHEEVMAKYQKWRSK
jgi:uncharacterized protein YaeQ